MWGAPTAVAGPSMAVNASMPNVSTASEPTHATQQPPPGEGTVQPNGHGFVPSSLQNLPTTATAATTSTSVGQQPLLNGGGVGTATASAAGSGVDPNTIEELQELIDEMRSKDFDSVRFATYRTACKLRFVQTKTKVHLVDIWNTIESFRENGLNAMVGGAQLKISRLELLLTSMFHNLNKRLPTTQHINTHKSISMLLGFLLSAYDRKQVGRITIFAVKVALVTMCAGKMADKLRYIFSQISSDSTGLMDYDRFVDYLQAVLRLPHAVFESPTFFYSPEALQQCFRRDQSVNVNQFLDTVMGDACPPCLMWLPLLHRMASVEHVYHPVMCDACQVTAFTGFRYKCQRCTNYQLCQSCFWRGRTSQWHTNEHEMKEYSSYKSPTKQLAHSIQKSLQCIPLASSSASGGDQKHHHPRELFPTKPQRPLDLTNIVPMTPNTLRHHKQGVLDANDFAFHPSGGSGGAMGELTGRLRLPGQYGLVNGGGYDGGAGDDEHKLIARYAAKLAGRTTFQSPSKLIRMQQQQREKALHERAVIARLEEENAEMARELALLEQQQSLGDNSAQLSGLRERTAELEARMREKQAQRRQLMQKLEQLMSQLHTHPVASLDGGGFSYAGLSAGGGSGACSMSREQSLGFQSLGLGAIRGTSVGTTTAAAQLQGDLLQAADAITANMGHLVKELDEAVVGGPSEDPGGGTEEEMNKMFGDG